MKKQTIRSRKPAQSGRTRPSRRRRRRLPHVSPLLVTLILAVAALLVLGRPLLTGLSSLGNAVTICVDPGHGGKDPGCTTDDRHESDDNLRLALAVQKKLEDQGVRVIMTRSDDTYLTLEERCTVANQAGADLFLSLHRNIADGSASGVEVWKSHIAGDESNALADNVLTALENVGIQQNRGVHIGSQSSETEDYYVLGHTKMPSLLIELGFLDNDEDNRLFDSNLERYAEAIARGALSTYEEFHGNNPS